MTNIAITEMLQPDSTGRNNLGTKDFPALPSQRHEIRLFDSEGKETDQWTVFSIGGGALAEENDGASSVNTPDVY